ncbi:MAG: hypothetical protein IJ094_07415 [Bacilli bacterium]|nr:hypothetical protein [Bacilli bacterium]
MTSEFLNLLNTCNYEEIKDYILEKELQFYENDMVDIVLSLGFTIPNYNKLMDILEINDNDSPIYSEIFTDEVLVNSISIYKTNVYNLYFVRKEQFGLRDEDAVISDLVFTNNIERIIALGKDELLRRYLVKDVKLNKKNIK